MNSNEYKEIISYYTDNPVSQTVMKSLQDKGFPIKHIREFNPNVPAIFYGILRGAGLWQHTMKSIGVDWFYIDNGYSGAQYVDKKGIKSMEGTYRVCKNKKIEQYPNPPKIGDIPKSVLVLPPSEATAFADGTTIDDWMNEQVSILSMPYQIRKKNCNIELEDQLSHFDGMLCYNSMAALEAVRQGKSVHTTNGIFPFTGVTNSNYYDYENLKSFYIDKQFTLENLYKGIECLI